MLVSIFYATKMKKQSQQHKTRYIAFVAGSIDGRISLTSKTEPHFTSKEDWQFFQRALARMDAVLVGRNTYLAVASRLRKRTTYVLTRRIYALYRRGSVTFINPTRVSLHKILGQYKTVAVLGGGSVYRFMLEHGLLDEIYVTVEPYIFGRGKTMFTGGTKTFTVSLQSVHRINQTGTLLLHYHVKHQKS